MEEYKNLQIEASAIIENNRPKKEWPDHGKIIFDKVSARYRSDLPFVLENISFTINPNQKMYFIYF